ncbi:hypothetical protein B0H11DRAFT_1663978, partial [Mycena galericulata]
TLEPGYREVQLRWQGGGAATLVLYKHLAGAATTRPHAGAFLHYGGFVSRIAMWLNPDLVCQTMAGPSTRVSEHHRGHILTGAIQAPGSTPRSATLTRDQVSEDEIKLLLGYIDKGGPEEDLTLFPPLYLLEQELPSYFHGVMSTDAQKFFEGILKKIESSAIEGCWKTRAGWTGYLRTARHSNQAPTSAPEKSDFEEGARILGEAFGGTWHHRKIRNIIIPE